MGVTCVVLAISMIALTITNVIVIVSWTRTIRSMRAARDDMHTARSTYDTALRQMGYERRANT